MIDFKLLEHPVRVRSNAGCGKRDIGRIAARFEGNIGAFSASGNAEAANKKIFLLFFIEHDAAARVCACRSM
ncbi:hypothetical protein [Roseibium aggregatum]|uniref:hypothetical protein n=1 Tax=Roseibium aggregatum TaxID=187304 RepID=UPI001681A2F3|nr:hypothetical protein [Roseibium aggregatum]